jgi:hypothetical protein
MDEQPENDFPFPRLIVIGSQSFDQSSFRKRATDSFNEAAELVEGFEAILKTLKRDSKMAEKTQKERFTGFKNAVLLSSHWDNRANRLDARRALDNFVEYKDGTYAVTPKLAKNKDTIEKIRGYLGDDWDMFNPKEIVDECTKITQELKRNIALIKDSLKVVSGEMFKLPDGPT